MVLGLQGDYGFVMLRHVRDREEAIGHGSPGPDRPFSAVGSIMDRMEGRGVAVEVRGLAHTYASPEGPLRVLAGLDFAVPAGGYCTLQGPSGAGKTTLLALVGGLERLQSGTVLVGDAELSSLSGDRLAQYRRTTVGFVFQHFGLLDTLSAQENVELACTLARVPPRERRRRGQELLDAVGLAERATHRPTQLSGGERQRVAMARALANRPRLLLADEPTGNLDEQAAVLVIELLEEIQRATGCTLMVVTHNQRLAARAPQQLRLDGGKAVPT